MSIVIDASVFVAASRMSEQQNPDSLAFLHQVRLTGQELFCPSLVLPECAGAISRTTKDARLANRIVRLIISTPHLRLVTMSTTLAEQAAELAGDHLLRGADACYVAVARELNATLATWDVEMLQRGSAVVHTCTPRQWVEKNATRPPQ